MKTMKARMYLVFEGWMIVFLLGLNIAFLNDSFAGAVLFKSAASLFFCVGGRLRLYQE